MSGREVEVSLEWVPIVTAVSSLLGAAIGGWVGGRQSRKTQERQHQLEREREISTRSLQKADEAISALRFLQAQGTFVVNWRNPTAHPYFAQSHVAHDVLGGAIEYLPDATVREQLTTVHFLIGTAYMKRGAGERHLAEAVAEVWSVCTAGIDVLGRYLRNEPTKDLARHWLAKKAAMERVLERDFDTAEQRRTDTQV